MRAAGVRGRLHSTSFDVSTGQKGGGLGSVLARGLGSLRRTGAAPHAARLALASLEALGAYRAAGAVAQGLVERTRCVFVDREKHIGRRTTALSPLVPAVTTYPGHLAVNKADHQSLHLRKIRPERPRCGKHERRSRAADDGRRHSRCGHYDRTFDLLAKEAGSSNAATNA